MKLSIIIEGIVQLPKTTGPKRKIVLALQRNKELKGKKNKRLLLIRDRVCRGLLHHFSSVCGSLRHILRCSLKGTIRHKFLLNVIHNQARMMLRHPLHEEIEALHVVLAQVIKILVRVFEVLYRRGPNILQFQLQVTDLLVLQLVEVLLHL